MPAISRSHCQKLMRSSQIARRSSKRMRGRRVRHGHTADDLSATFAQCANAGGERGAARHHVVYQDDALLSAVTLRPRTERAPHIARPIAHIALGLLLGVTHATEAPRVQRSACTVRELPGQEGCLIVPAFSET